MDRNEELEKKEFTANSRRLSEELRKHYEEMLVTLYEVDPAAVTAMSDDELVSTLRTKELASMRKVRNPNAFWILKTLPPPPEVKPTTSSKAGLWVVLSLFIALLLFLGVALLVVFLK